MSTNTHLQSLLTLVISPWLVFVVVACSFALPPQGWVWRVLAAFVFMCCQALAAVLVTVHFTGRKGPIYLYLGVLCCVATISGWWFGMQVFDRDMVTYWMNHAGASYAGVAASSSAAAVKDASIVQFNTAARVDLRQVLGFRPQGTDVTYCVAPVLDTVKPKEAQFWAVGTDCCEPLRSFLCDDSGKPGARSGLVVTGLGSEYAANEHKHFKEAAAQAANLYGIKIPEEPGFVRWYEDAEKVQNNVLGNVILELVLTSFMYLMASVFAAGWLHLSSSYKREASVP